EPEEWIPFLAPDGAENFRFGPAPGTTTTAGGTATATTTATTTTTTATSASTTTGGADARPLHYAKVEILGRPIWIPGRLTLSSVDAAQDEGVEGGGGGEIVSFAPAGSDAP